jgi:thioredoxin 2
MDQATSEIIRCAQCEAQNRIPLERITAHAQCGRCHAPLSLGANGANAPPQVLRCSECAAKNRVPSNKVNDHPKCGKCGSMLRLHDLSEPQPVAISDRNFQDKVLKSPLPVLVFAMSPTCPSCVTVAPHIEALAREYRGRVKVGRLNVQLSPELAARFQILSVPYLLVFDRGQLLESLPGGLDKRGLEHLVSRYLY